jgi:hypothetical protein
MIDATGNLVEEANGDWCGADAPALIIDCGNVQYTRPILDVKAALTGRSGCDAQLWHLQEEIPGQQLFDLINGMIGDALEEVTQVALGVQIVEFRGAK